MLPLYHDPWHTFRFAGDRVVPRFHLEGVGPGDESRCSSSTSQRASDCA